MAVADATTGRTWAQVARKPEDAAVIRVPSGRGSRSCPCVGEIIGMLGHYGWILVQEAIDHPEAAKHGGRVYLSAKDIRGGSRLKEGDRVEFFLYADGNGLGAEDCRLVPGGAAPSPGFEAPPVKTTTSFPPLAATKGAKRATKDAAAPSPAPGGLRAGAAEFTPPALRAEAAEFTPSAPGGLRAEAAEFTPAAAPIAKLRTGPATCPKVAGVRAAQKAQKEVTAALKKATLQQAAMEAGLRPEAPVFKPSAMLKAPHCAPKPQQVAACPTINPLFLNCDSDSESEGDDENSTAVTSAGHDEGITAEVRLGRRLAAALRLAQDDDESDSGESGALADGSDAEDSEEEEVLGGPPLVVKLSEVAGQAVLPLDFVKAPLCDSAASTSGGDSGSDTSGSEDSAFGQYRKLPPPGLSPPSIRPPPGLSLVQ